MDCIPRLSSTAYVGLCRELGSPTEVRIRREVMDTEEAAMKSLFIMIGCDKMKSGSKREGFRLSFSDYDFMLWPPDHKVICDLSQICLYRIPQHTVILMECDDLPPGFTRLNLLSPSKNPNIRSSCVFRNDEVNISSALFRSSQLQYFKSWFFPYALHHGPCSTCVLEDNEADFAFCFQSKHWPIKALPMIQRCRQQGWPSETVLMEIISGGFHVVPIGSTLENGEEWRISFSQAEQKLVYSMDHCQFLCYGLFKIFLKEVINFQNNTTIICSYYIKTCIFWVIQNEPSLTWTPVNLLSCFWKCFKLLLYWVRVGECPNFFIPENNMFRVKVTGSVQDALFRQLYDLYCKGISCLLLSETIRPYLSQAIVNRKLIICTEENSLISSTELDFSFFKEVKGLIHKSIDSIEEFKVYMKYIKKIITENLTPYQTATLQLSTSAVLRSIALLIQNKNHILKNCNKIQYKSTKVSNILLQLSCKFGYVSDFLYLAAYLYRDCRFEHSLNCLRKAQERMSPPYCMRGGNMNVYMYIQCMTGIPLSRKIRRAVMDNIKLQSDYTYINELVLEQKISRKHGMPSLDIQPPVMLYMLFTLNHHRLGDTVRSKKSLQDLQNLMLYAEGFNVPNYLRDISWQIMGICQQNCGDYSGSFRSYQYSFQQEPFHFIQEATLLRMNALPHGGL
ncbi:uncharacterized protein LOC134283745 [Saccostrea cucullata]|uniref:uncharacterized protein LOC134283745 n=1 Tax=Saccostrea cuccullata TaxID=36930 RepID=UPI002ED66DD1